MPKHKKNSYYTQSISNGGEAHTKMSSGAYELKPSPRIECATKPPFERRWVYIILPTLVSLSLASVTTLTYASCSSTITNSQQTNASISSTSDNQCLVNTSTGVITTPPGGGAIGSYYNNITIDNFGTLATSTSGTGIFVAGNNYTIHNEGNIIASSAGNTVYGIWIYPGAPGTGTILNTGKISITHGSQSVGIFNYDSSTLSQLTNTGSIIAGNDTGGGYAIGNNGTINLLTNSGTIQGLGNSTGVSNNGGTIDTLLNTGSIITATDIYPGINNSGTITNLNNLQGQNATPTIALTYKGVLPTNYNIIISGQYYGQLAATNVTGTTNFGILSGSTLQTRHYEKVLQGITANELNVLTGQYDGLTWSLDLENGSLNIWDLNLSGASLSNTQVSMHNTLNQVRSIYRSQFARINNAFNLEAAPLSTQRVNLALAGRFTSTTPNDSTSSYSSLTGSYHLNEHFQIGGLVDKSISSDTNNAVYLNKGNPFVGIYGIYTQHPGDAGFALKLSTNYDSRTLNVTRSVYNLSEPGTGSTRLTSQGSAATLMYHYSAGSSWLLTPSIGLCYMSIAAGGYSEASASNVTKPLTYAPLKQTYTSALANLRIMNKTDLPFGWFGSIGVEHDIQSNNPNYAVSGLTGLVAENLKATNEKKTRLNSTLGSYFSITPQQQLSLSISAQEDPLSAHSVTTLLSYSVGI